MLFALVENSASENKSAESSSSKVISNSDILPHVNVCETHAKEYKLKKIKQEAWRDINDGILVSLTRGKWIKTIKTMHVASHEKVVATLSPVCESMMIR